MQRLVVLCFVAYYLPGYRSGGPVRTIANFVDHMSKYYEIKIVTSDHDVMNDKTYDNIISDSWNKVGNATVYYISDKKNNLRGIIDVMREVSYDLLYVNSYFSPKFTILPLLLRKLKLVPKTPCVVAPRGEFADAALRLKPVKKNIYLFIAKIFGIYRDVVWQASSALEAKDIRRVNLEHTSHVIVAPNLPAKKYIFPFSEKSYSDSFKHDCIRIVFLSRISPMKNLDYLLNALLNVRVQVELSIYGPLRDKAYWKKCSQIINIMPKNIKVYYCGEVLPRNVSKIISNYDLFVLPTRGENYGHVILESLVAGTPVLISDRTPWVSTSDGAVNILSLDDPSDWTNAIEKWSEYDMTSVIDLKATAKKYAEKYLHSNKMITQNKKLFSKAMGIDKD